MNEHFETEELKEELSPNQEEETKHTKTSPKINKKKKKKKLKKFIPKEILNLINPFKTNGILFLSAIIVILILILAIFIFPFYLSSKENGNAIGNAAGNTAGIAVGSYKGITDGLPAGYKAGEIEGLSAKDTKVQIANKMNKISKLDVLVSKGSLIDRIEFGKNSENSALCRWETITTFSINMKEVEITQKDNQLTIILPKPECEFIIDAEATEKLADSEKFSWNLGEGDGNTAYNNSLKQIKKKGAKALDNYYMLVEQAKESAQIQIDRLARNVSGGKYLINVVFTEEEYSNAVNNITTFLEDMKPTGGEE